MSTVPHRPRPRRGDQRGLTILELVIAITVFSVLAGGIALTIDGGLNLARQNRNRSIGANLASQEMDRIRLEDFADLPIGLSEVTREVGGVPYTVARDITWVDNDSDTSPCEAAGGGTQPRVLRIVVRVSWNNMRGVPPVRSTSLLSPPVGSYDPNSGHIAVRVLDRFAEPLGGVSVRVQGGSVDRTQLTTVDPPGCAFFAFLPEGNYDVTLNTAGFVDRQGQSNPSQLVGVQEGEVSSVAFDYDQAGSLQLTFVAPSGAAIPNGLPLTLGNTDFLPNGTRSYGGSGLTRTISSLFPSLDGYTAWGGECSDADPQGQDTEGIPYWDGGQRGEGFAVDPGSTTSGTVELAAFEIEFELLSAPHPDHDVVATHVPDTGCPGGESYVLATFDDPTGEAVVALPYGVWELSVPEHTPEGGSWPVVVLSPLDSSLQEIEVRIL